MKKILSIALIIVTLLTFTGCEVTVDTEKPFGFKIKEKLPVEVYKKGLFYCKLGELEPYTGKAFMNFGDSKEYFELNNGQMNGKYYVETKQGEIRQEGNYKNGKKEGVYFYYDLPTGFTIKEIYQNGVLLQERSVNNSNYEIKTDLIYKDSQRYEGFNYNYSFYAKEDERYILELYKKGKYTQYYLTYSQFYNREKIKDIDKFFAK